MSIRRLARSLDRRTSTALGIVCLILLAGLIGTAITAAYIGGFGITQWRAILAAAVTVVLTFVLAGAAAVLIKD